MAENFKEVVVDASFVLAYLLPDEKSGWVDKIFRQYVQGEIVFISTSLLPLEVLNGLRTAVLKKRFSEKLAGKLAQAFLLLDIKLEPVDFLVSWQVALRKGISVYDASYLALSLEKKTKLLTVDKKLKLKI